jgi:eukaryotic-like serine/threonine-protein kinase
MTTALSCLHCGDTLAPGSRFCAQCGLEVFEEVTPPAGESISPWLEVVQRLQSATLGEFEIGRELGRGAMAAVFLAREIALDRKVAIKVMSPGLLMGEGMIERFKREAITIAHLNHPNIVSVHSVRQTEGLHFFVMRYIQGRSLEQVIHQAGKLPVPIVRSILCQVGSALTYAHRSGVVHRDIKPANILIDEDGNAVVTDFGIAKVAEAPSDTHSGALVGTPAYMSPEQCSGAEVSGASDQYALGAVAYEMLTGKAPFTGSTLTVIQAHVEQPPRSIRELRGDCAPEMEAAIFRMLAKDPGDRYSTMTEAKAALGAIPLGEEDPLLAELRRWASPERDSGPRLIAALEQASRVRPPVARVAPPPGLVRTITILPPPAALEEGESFALVALVRGEHGTPLPGRTVQWSSEAPTVLRVDPAKQVAFAVAPGSAWLTAACEGVRSRLQVQVAAAMADALEIPPSGAVASIEISAPPKSVKAGDSFVLTATPLDYRGDSLPDQPVLWNTSDVSVAVVTAIGWVTTLGPGSVVLTATCQGASASVTVNVEQAAHAPRRALSSSATVRDQPPPTAERRTARRRRGSRTRRRLALALGLGLLIGGGVLWRNGSFAKLTSYSARRPAAVTVAAAEPTIPPDSVATILRGAPASVAITRRPRRPMVLGGLSRLVAEVRDAAGRPLPRATVAWFSSNPRVVRVDSTGALRAIGAGRAQVVASSGESRDSTIVVVQRAAAGPAAPASLSITPHGSLRVGDTTTLRASVFDGSGAALSNAEVTWSSSEPRVAAVDPRSGVVRGYAPGTALVIANSGSQSAMSLMTVVAGDGAADTLRFEAYAPEDGALKQPEESATRSEGVSPENDAAGRQQLEAMIVSQVEQCYEAIRTKDIARMTEMYRPATRSDQDQLKKLSRILRTPEWKAVVSERVDGAPQVGDEAAAMEFSLTLSWKDSNGRLLTSRPLFRAEFGKHRSEWELSSCRIVGSPEL